MRELFFKIGIRLRVRFRHCVLFRHDLKDVASDMPVRVDAPVQFGPVDASEARSIGDYEDRFHSQADVLNRLKTGDRLFAARVGGRIASFIWVRTGEFMMGSMDQRFVLPPGRAQIMGVFTKPEYRGKGLAKAHYAWVLRWLKNHSFNTAYLDVDAWNHASLASVRGVGFREYLRVYYLRLVLLRLYWMHRGDPKSFLVRCSKKPCARFNRIFYPEVR